MNLVERPECYILLTDHPKIKIPWFIPLRQVYIKVQRQQGLTQILGEILPERYSFSYAVINLLNWALQPCTIASYFTLHNTEGWLLKFDLNPYRVRNIAGEGNRPRTGLIGYNTEIAEVFINGYMADNILVIVE
jgi:hypothetical protein